MQVFGALGLLGRANYSLNPAILVSMLAAVLFLLHPSSPPSIDELDHLAQKRDIAGLSSFLIKQPTTVHNPFDIIRTNGAYEVGRFGWHALPLKSPDGSDYVVFSTPMTSEDTGELLFARLGNELRFVPETESFGIKLLRHDFDLRFNISTKTATLIDKLKLKPSDSVGQDFLFRMSPQYLVSSIVNAAGESVNFAEAGGIVATAKPTKEDTYTIHYSARVDLPNYAGSISEKEASLTNDYWYPMVARQPVAYDLTIHAPPKWTPVGQGEPIEEKVTATEHMIRYRMDLPCVYYSVTAGPFIHYRQQIHGKWYSCWSAAMTQEQMEAQTEFYAPIIEFYSRFCPFPFTGYGAVDSAVYGGGALEAYSFTTWGHGSLPMEDAHEPSHTWWGGVINNSYLGSFWNESFAVFSDGMYHRGVAIGNPKERSLAFIQDGNAAANYKEASLAQSGADIGSIASSLGYGKGSQVLQMLEQLLGTEKMLNTMQEWIKTSRGTISDWADYETVVTKLNPDKNIKTFFDDWIRKPGYADLNVSQVQFLGDHVAMNVAFNGPNYRIPLEVMLQFKDGARTFTTIDLERAGSVTIPCSSKPALVSVDPWRRILRTVASNETPTQINGTLEGMPRYSDPAHPEYLNNIGKGMSIENVPSDPEGKFIVGNPATLPLLNSLCEKVGFKVSGTKLTYDGTTIDLNHGCAVAVVDLPEGKRCLIGLGKTRVAPDFGRSRLALTDDLGRFVRGKTDPKTQGNLTFKIP